MLRDVSKRMMAVVLHDWNDMRYEEVDIPLYGPDEVLCRVKGCGICGTDAHIIEGNFAGVWPPKLPFIMGHEWYGEVAEVGSRVKGLSTGQRVIGEVQKGCGRCDRCMEGRYHLCMNAGRPDEGYVLYGHTMDGAYAEYIKVAGTNLHLMPDYLEMEEGISACNVGIGIEAVRRANIDVGDDVLVIGVGLLGLIILQLAKIAGAGRTIAVGRGYRLEMADKLGADEKVDRMKCDVVERVKELTSGNGVDVVFEAAGAEEATRNALDCVRRGGRVVLTGIASNKKTPIDTSRVVLDEIAILGARGAPNAFPEAIRLLESGRINVKPLITHKMQLSEVHRGMEVFTNRLENVIRVALIP